MEPYQYPERADGDELFASSAPRPASPGVGILTAFALVVAALAIGGL
jgi:hypothetical protein